MVISEIFDGIATTIAQMNPIQMVNLKAPENMSERVSELIERKKEGIITIDETAELERFLALDLFISLAKAKARLLLKS